MVQLYALMVLDNAAHQRSRDEVGSKRMLETGVASPSISNVSKTKLAQPC